MKRLVKNFVDVRYIISKKLNSIIRKGKDSLKDYQMTEVVYKINCKDCDQVYIGQTKRYLETRIKEQTLYKKILRVTFLLLRIIIDCLLITILKGINLTYYARRKIGRRERSQRCFS